MQWGAWAAIGMVAGNTAVHRAMERSGVGMLQPHAGLAAMQLLVGSVAASAAAQLAAIPFVWQRFMRAPRNAAAFFYAEHAQAAEFLHPVAALPAPRPAAAPSAAAAAPLPLPDEVLQRVLAAVAAVHGSSVDPQQPLLQAGLDSLGEWGSLSRHW